MNILDGKVLAAEKNALTKVKVSQLESVPALAVLLVGDDYASHLYVKLKEKAAKEVGIDFHKYLFDEMTTQEELIEAILFLRADDAIDGMIVQFPLPAHLDSERIIEALGAQKDVDGFHPENIAAFNNGTSNFWPVFPKAMVALAQSSEQDLEDKNALIIARSDLFSQAMVAACTRVGMRAFHKECKVSDVGDALGKADVIFSACGAPESIGPDDVKEGAIIVDGGMSKKGDHSVGDIAFEEFEDAEMDVYLTPVPGGVGPVTIACLLENVVELAQKRDT